MNVEKKLGIWMDHQNAHVIEVTPDPMVTSTIKSKSSGDSGLHSSENKIHSKEQGQQTAYYTAIGKIICEYDSVVLFGPTQAKNELFNMLSEDQHFSKIKIQVEQADKMTEPQQHAFVRNFFATVL